MNRKLNILSILLLMLLIAGGTALAVTGLKLTEAEEAVQDQHYRENAVQNAYHPKVSESKRTITGAPLMLAQDRVDPVQVYPGAAEEGITVGELMRLMGIFSVISAIIILLCIEFLFKHRIQQINYRVLLIISLFVLPVLVGLSTAATVLETTKTVESCATCHVMDPFVNDLYDSESSTLAARHFKNKWIPEYQCYTCHTTYGAHGTFEGKRDGFRHWLLYVTGTYPDPIRFAGSYPNKNCTACHGATPAYDQVPGHHALTNELAADEVSCTSCHGPAHPVPAEREAVAAHHSSPAGSLATRIETEDVKAIMEAINNEQN